MDSILREGKLLTSNNLNKKFLTDSPKVKDLKTGSYVIQKNL